MSKIQKLVRIGKAEQGVPVHVRGVLVHIGFWKGVPVHLQGVPVHMTRKCPECVFSHIFPYF